MRSSQRATGRATQTQRTNARLIASTAILLMPAEELLSRVEEEIALNPALEVTWDQLCPDCGRALVNGVCWSCRLGRGSEEGGAHSGGVESLSPPWRASTHTGDDDRAYDPIENASEQVSLQEHVLQQARLVLGSRAFAIAEYLVAGLNEDGLLEADLAGVATAVGVPREEVEDVLARLQTLDPPGVCARSVQESVLIQLRELSADHAVPPHLEPILRQHWRDLANHSYAKIGRELGIGQEEVAEAVEYLRHKLCPYPGRLYHPPHAGRQSRSRQLVRPDVVIHREGSRYLIEVVRPYDFELRVSEAYRRLCATRRRSRGESAEMAQAMEQYQRATWLLQSLQSREDTLRRVAACTAEYQRAFLDTGQETRIRSLSRTYVAEQIGKDVSTVSRAIAEKYVLLPTGDTIPFAKLLAPAEAPKTIIAELLAKENPDEPLTDEKIARILQMRGITLARRTIAKYRLALKLPSSVQRGRH